MRTDFMRYHSTDPDFWSRWIDEYRHRLECLKQSGAWWREIETTDLLEGDFSTLHSLVNDLGLGWNEEGVRGFIRPQYWHDANSDE